MNNFNIVGEQQLTNLNHNFEGNPHPQYQLELFNIIPEHFPINQWHEIATVNITSGNNRGIYEITLQSASYSSYMAYVRFLLIVQQQGDLSKNPRVEIRIKESSKDFDKTNQILRAFIEKTSSGYIVRLCFKSIYNALGEIKCYCNTFDGKLLEKGLKMYSDSDVSLFTVIECDDDRPINVTLGNYYYLNGNGITNPKMYYGNENYIKFYRLAYPIGKAYTSAKFSKLNITMNHKGTDSNIPEIELHAKIYYASTSHISASAKLRNGINSNNLKLYYTTTTDDENVYIDFYMKNLNTWDTAFIHIDYIHGENLISNDFNLLSNTVTNLDNKTEIEIL